MENLLDKLRIKQGYSKKQLSERTNISLDRIEKLCTYGTRIKSDEAILLSKLVNCDSIALVDVSMFEYGDKEYDW